MNMTVKIVAVLALITFAATAAHAQETAAPATPKYETSLALGLMGTEGNSDIQQLTANFLSLRKAETSECKFGFDYAYGEIGGNATNNNVKVFTGYRRNINDRLYGVFDLSYFYDEIGDIDYRVTASPGLGYHLVKSDVQTFSVEAGPSYIWEKVGGVEDDYPALRLFEKYERKLSDTAKVWESVEYLPRFDDFDDYLLSAEVGVEAAINSSMSLRLVVVDKYDSTPAPEKEENDVTVTGSLVYKI
jgi:putative salt-induced outer membrane protein